MSEPELKNTEEMILNGEVPATPVTGGTSAPAPEKPRLEGGKLLLVTIAVVLGIGLIVVFLVMRDTDKVKPKTFTADPVTITLTNRFSESEDKSGQYESVYSSPEVIVFLWEKAFTAEEKLSEYTPEEFADELVQLAELPAAQIKSEDGRTWFDYESKGSDGQTYRYYVYAYKTDSSFWMAEFVVLGDYASDYAAQIHEWAASVRIRE